MMPRTIYEIREEILQNLHNPNLFETPTFSTSCINRHTTLKVFVEKLFSISSRTNPQVEISLKYKTHEPGIDNWRHGISVTE